MHTIDRNAARRLRIAAINVVSIEIANSGEYGGWKFTRSRANVTFQKRRSALDTRSVEAGSATVHGLAPNTFGRNGKNGLPVSATMRPYVGSTPSSSDPAKIGTTRRRFVPNISM